MTKTLAAAVCAVLMLASCKTTATNFSQSYRNPGYEQTVFQKLMVIGIASDAESRKSFEDALVGAIRAQGGAAEPSYETLPGDEQITEEQLHAAIDAGGFDAVVLTRLVSIDKSKDYTPPKKYNKPKTRYYPAGWGYGFGYGGFYGFYGTTYAEVHQAGYFDTSTTLTLETNLYSVATNDLVWTGRSDTIDPESIDDAQTSATNAVAAKLKEERLIP